FGNPEKPEIMGQFVGAIKGIGEACRALDMPIVSGNVSLYNETDGTGILPTPTIAAVGLLKSLDELIAGRPAEGDLAVVIGEKRNGDFLRGSRKLIRAATDLSDGGLALAAFEMAEAAGLGARIDAGETAFLFGEDQARYLVAVRQADLAVLTAAAKAARVPLALVGQFGGDRIAFGASSAPLAELSHLYRTAFESALF